MKTKCCAAILTLALAVGCGGDGAENETVDTGDTTPTETPQSFDDDEIAAALWDEIVDYETWGQREGWTTEPVESNDHSGAHVVAFYNGPLLAWPMTGDAPDGSISVKEQWGHGAATGCGCGTPCGGCGTGCTPTCGTGCTPTCGTGCTPTCGTGCTPTCGGCTPGCTPGTGSGELELQAFTVMKKIAGYDPDAGDWFWAMYNANGAVLQRGQVDMCIGCHATAAADYVFGAPPE